MEVLLKILASVPAEQLVIGTLGAMIVASCYMYMRGRDIPPGPLGVPFLGYLPFLLKSDPHFQLHDLQKKYGDVFSFRIMNRLFINLGSTKLAREAHVSKSNFFLSRPLDYSLLNAIIPNGIFNSNGEKWRHLRYFFVKQFKELGMNTTQTVLGDPMSDGTIAVLSDLQKANGQPVNMEKLLGSRSHGILLASLFREGGISLQEIEDIGVLYSNVTANLSPYNVLFSGNIPRFTILPFLVNSDMFKNLRLAQSMVDKIVKKNKDSFNENNANTLIARYYKERNLRQRNGDPTYKYFTDRDLLHALVQIIGDSAGKVPPFISTFITALLEHPEQQELILQEVLEIVGEDRQPTVEDRSRMPYTNAFLNEVLRTADFLPLIVGLLCTQETTIGGYRIPKGAVTITNTWSAHHDSKVYNEPEKFDPSRFLVEDNKKRPELPIGFGIGKRSCIAEGYVMTQAFLFVTILVKNFQLSWVDEDAFRNSDSGFRKYRNLMICANPRNTS